MTELTGIVPNLDEQTYHAHPALSSTQARQILDSPARYHWGKTHPRPDKAEFDLGSAIHSKVLGTGYTVTVIPDEVLASNGATSTKAAKEFIEAERTAGRIPIKREVADEVNLVAESVLAHPTARALFEQEGIAEASVFATDPVTGVPLRARFDYLAEISVDLKSGRDASLSGFARSVASYGYDVQDGHYIDTLELATGERRQMVFVVVETEAPHLVAVHQLDRDFTEMGVKKARRAREIYAECLTTDTWPGYPTEIGLVIPPMYAVYDFQDNYS